MSQETSRFEKKSLRHITKDNPAWTSIAADCVAFAMGPGGEYVIGIEDGESEPPPGQKVGADQAEQVRRRISQLTVNVNLSVEVATARNGGQYLRLAIPRSLNVPSTTNGHYYYRDGDETKPVTGDDILRVAADRVNFGWESLAFPGVREKDLDPEKVKTFCSRIRESKRVKDLVKEKSDSELLHHYNLVRERTITNLGILCVGKTSDRARLSYAPIIQAIKYDAQERKIRKHIWDDFALNPMQMVDEVWASVPDFHEFYEVPNGLLRDKVPAYDKKVVRELLVNALVHRPYTQSGDIFVNLHPDRLEIVNPGRLPFGVTVSTLLHASVRRNPGLARVFHDLEYMENEGTGIDLIYQTLLSQARPIPEISEGIHLDRVSVTVSRQMENPRLLDFMTKANQTLQLTPREMISLGILSQSDGMTARDLADHLGLEETGQLKRWLGRLLDLEVVRASGLTRGTRYFVSPQLLKSLDFSASTSLARIEPHRLEALIYEDVRRFPNSSIGDIEARIGSEIGRSQIRRALARLIEHNRLRATGERRWTRYTIVQG